MPWTFIPVTLQSRLEGFSAVVLCANPAELSRLAINQISVHESEICL